MTPYDILIFWLVWEAASFVACLVRRPGELTVVPIGLAMGALQTGIGFLQKAKAAKMASENKRPILQDNPYTDQIYGLAGSYAGQGLSSSAMQAYNTGNDRNASSSLDALMKTGASVNNIGDLYEGSQSGLRAMALADQEAKMRNVNQYIEAIGLKADEDRDQFLVNEQAPFQDKAAAATQMAREGMDNAFKGLNTIGSSLMATEDETEENDRSQKEGITPSEASKRKQPSTLASGRAVPSINLAIGGGPASMEQTLTGATTGMQLRTSQRVRPGDPLPQNLKPGFNTNRPFVPARFDYVTGQFY